MAVLTPEGEELFRNVPSHYVAPVSFLLVLVHLGGSYVTTVADLAEVQNQPGVFDSTLPPLRLSDFPRSVSLPSAPPQAPSILWLVSECRK